MGWQEGGTDISRRRSALVEISSQREGCLTMPPRARAETHRAAEKRTSHDAAARACWRGGIAQRGSACLDAGPGMWSRSRLVTTPAGRRTDSTGAPHPRHAPHDVDRDRRRGVVVVDRLDVRERLIAPLALVEAEDRNARKLDLDYETNFFGMVVMKMYQIRSLMFL